MAMKLSQAVSTRAHTELPFEGTEDKLNVYHNPSCLTCEYEAAIRAEEHNEVASEFLVQTLARTLLEWDLIDDEGIILGEDRKGEVVPITAEYLRRVPVELLVHVVTAIGDAHRTSPKNATTPTRSGSFS